jgi:hypothetical protein
MIEGRSGAMKLERGVLEIRNGRYVDTDAPVDCPDGHYWFATDEKRISKIYGPFASSREAANAAAETQLSQREVEAILNKLAQEGLIECTVIDGTKWYWRARKDH